MIDVAENPAILAAKAAQEKVNLCIDDQKNFRLEAGAGAGKTYSLVEALRKIIMARGPRLLRAGQRVACITYTEVAKKEIAQDVEQHPAIVVETIHAFCWGFMSQFQTILRQLVGEIEDRQERIAEGGGIGQKRVEYSLGFFSVDDDKITLFHDDIPLLMSKMLDREKFRNLLAESFPIIFIDEYQDTDRHFMGALTKHFFETASGPLIGLFGDHWQTIYRGDYALADFPNVEGIDKGANFRSAVSIVDVLNRLRPELKQAVKDENLIGEARFFHANSYVGERTNSVHSKTDLPDDMRQKYFEAVVTQLKSDGWDWAPGKTKILMLTHSAIAGNRGYPNLLNVFDYNDDFVRKADPCVEFFANTVEPMCRAYKERKFGEMFDYLGQQPTIKRHTDKEGWQKDMAALNDARAKGTIGSVIDVLNATARPHLGERVLRRERDLQAAGPDEVEGEPRSITRYRQMRNVPYLEMTNLVEFLDGATPFATQHSVKGAQFENVLVVLGGGWNHYNWPNLFELLETKKLTDKNEKGFHRARNLFYVAISRPEVRLAVLATQQMTPLCLTTASRLFGADCVHELPLPA